MKVSNTEPDGKRSKYHPRSADDDSHSCFGNTLPVKRYRARFKRFLRVDDLRHCSNLLSLVWDLTLTFILAENFRVAPTHPIISKTPYYGTVGLGTDLELLATITHEPLSFFTS